MRKKPSKLEIQQLRIMEEPFFTSKVIFEDLSVRDHLINFYIREDYAVLAIPSRVQSLDIKILGFNKNRYIFKTQGRPLTAISRNSRIVKLKTDHGIKVIYKTRGYVYSDVPENTAVIFNELEYRLFVRSKQNAILKAQLKFGHKGE